MPQESEVKDFIIQYLNAHTRYTFNDIELRDFIAFECVLDVTLNHTLKIIVNESKNNKTNTSILPLSEYQNMVQNKFDAEYINPQHLQALFKKINDSDWNQWGDILYDLPQSFTYKKRCNSCDGRGHITCIKCENGYKECSSCSGTGRVKKIENKKDRKLSYYIDCDRCRGTGIVKCSTCEGKGTVACFKCKASGILSTIATTTFRYKRQTHYDITPQGNYPFNPMEVINNLSLENLDEYGTTLRDTIEKKQQHIIEKYHIAIPMYECKINLDSKSFTWRLYGKDLQVASNDNIIMTILDSDIQALKNIAKSSYEPFLLLHTRKVIKPLYNLLLIKLYLNKYHQIYFKIWSSSLKK